MEIIDGIPWFTPPADTASARTPIRGGRPQPGNLPLHDDAA
jgi:hypothetical protein